MLICVRFCSLTTLRFRSPGRLPPRTTNHGRTAQPCRRVLTPACPSRFDSHLCWDGLCRSRATCRVVRSRLTGLYYECVMLCISRPFLAHPCCSPTCLYFFVPWLTEPCAAQALRSTACAFSLLCATQSAARVAHRVRPARAAMFYWQAAPLAPTSAMLPTAARRRAADPDTAAGEGGASRGGWRRIHVPQRRQRPPAVSVRGDRRQFSEKTVTKYFRFGVTKYVRLRFTEASTRARQAAMSARLNRSRTPF